MAESAIYIASDHAGWPLKEFLRERLSDATRRVVDLGPSDQMSVDYPEYANRLAEALRNAPADLGLLVCGSGIGMSIAANRHRHIRAALCGEPESASLARRHNDANVLVLGGRLVGQDMALAIVGTFLATGFDGGRHAPRVAMLSPTAHAAPS
jgi:ribose 5-phosphate isomerase B